MNLKRLMVSLEADQLQSIPVITDGAVASLECDLLRSERELNVAFEQHSQLTEIAVGLESLLTTDDSIANSPFAAAQMVGYGRQLGLEAVDVGVEHHDDSFTVSTEGVGEFAKKVVEILKKIVAKIADLLKEFFAKMTMGAKGLSNRLKQQKETVRKLLAAPKDKKINVSSIGVLHVGGKFDDKLMWEGLATVKNLVDYAYGRYTDNMLAALEALLFQLFGAKHLDDDTVAAMVARVEKAVGESQILATAKIPGGYRFNRYVADGSATIGLMRELSPPDRAEIGVLDKAQLASSLDAAIAIVDILMKRMEKVKGFNDLRIKAAKKFGDGSGPFGKLQGPPQTLINIAARPIQKGYEQGLTQIASVALGYVRGVSKLVEDCIKVYPTESKAA